MKQTQNYRDKEFNPEEARGYLQTINYDLIEEMSRGRLLSIVRIAISDVKINREDFKLKCRQN